jgi:hypothetical protein
LSLKPGTEEVAGNLLLCYEALIGKNILPAKELPLLQAWLADLKEIGPPQST